MWYIVVGVIGLVCGVFVGLCITDDSEDCPWSEDAELYEYEE